MDPDLTNRWRSNPLAMRSIQEVRQTLALVEQGVNDCEISRRTGIPRGTIRTWRVGGIPHSTVPTPSDRCPACGHTKHRYDRLPLPEYAYLLGLYLGDGSIASHARGVFRLGITLDRRYPGIIRECAEAMSTVMPTSKVGIQQRTHEQADFVNAYSRSWPCLFPQHGPGRKHRRPIRLASWQRRLVISDPRPLLRGLIHSDGSRHINTIRHPKRTYRYPRYEFTNRSEDIKCIFCDACDRIGIRWRVMNAMTISIARRESVEHMDEFIGQKC